MHDFDTISLLFSLFVFVQEISRNDAAMVAFVRVCNSFDFRLDHNDSQMMDRRD
jgi:hypothetical protein